MTAIGRGDTQGQSSVKGFLTRNAEARDLVQSLTAIGRGETRVKGFPTRGSDAKDLV